MESSERDLVVLGEQPLNAETPLARQSGTITPAERFFVRDHFAEPTPPERIAVEGAVKNALWLRLAEIRALPRRTLVVTLECAGNGRAFFEPRPAGVAWRLGAVSTAEWTGAPLREVLERAQPTAAAVEVVCRGADEGVLPGRRKPISFERALPLAKALDPDTLLAYEMNGRPLPRAHGGPLRLVVPGWYGMASVKWLAALTLVRRAFRGYFQAEHYVVGRRPLREVEVRAVITWPQDGDVITRRPSAIHGYCWSGRGAIASVEVSLDRGKTWDAARLGGEVSPYAWREWEYAWRPREAGPALLLARGVDADGHIQPATVKRNALGYANNAIRPVRVIVS